MTTPLGPDLEAAREAVATATTDAALLDALEVSGFLTLTLGLAVKLGSLAIHIQEGIDTGHPLDVAAAKALVDDPEVIDWLGSFAPGLLPERRDG